eukprot:SAG11_NODE_12655_length_685_cov_1.323777_1_plen_167_part_00
MPGRPIHPLYHGRQVPHDLGQHHVLGCQCVYFVLQQTVSLLISLTRCDVLSVLQDLFPLLLLLDLDRLELCRYSSLHNLHLSQHLCFFFIIRTMLRIVVAPRYFRVYEVSRSAKIYPRYRIFENIYLSQSFPSVRAWYLTRVPPGTFLYPVLRLLLRSRFVNAPGV